MNAIVCDFSLEIEPVPDLYAVLETPWKCDALKKGPGSALRLARPAAYRGNE